MTEISRVMFAAALFAAAPLATSSLAQSVAYAVPDDMPAVGNCNAIPFGSSSTSATWVNQRYQMIVTAQDLAQQPGLITGLRFAPCGDGEHVSQSIRITLALVPAGFSFTGGNDNFDQNLNVVGANALAVLDRQDHTWVKTADSWSSIGFERSYPYDGARDLLIDILVVGNSATVGGGQMRRDSRPRLYATGWTGAPPATGRAATGASRVRIDFGCADATLFGEGCSGLEHRFGGSSAMGSTLELQMRGGAASLPAAVNMGTLISAPFPIDLGRLGFTGCQLLTDNAVAVLGTSSDSLGRATVRVPIPSLPGAVGMRVYTQFLHVNLSAPGGGVSSNGGQVILGSGGC